MIVIGEAPQWLRECDKRAGTLSRVWGEGADRTRGGQATTKLSCRLLFGISGVQFAFYNGFSPSIATRRSRRRSVESKSVRACREQRLSHKTRSPSLQTCS